MHIKDHSYNYQELWKPAAKIMIKTTLGEKAKRTIDQTAFSDNTAVLCETSRIYEV